MNVLSLFDGMCAGLTALKETDIKVDNYFASEIDKYAIQIAKKNHPEIIHLGDVNNFDSWALPKIDLIIGGSPCQGFSFNGKKLNFNDPRSVLFFKYVACIDKFNPGHFFLENVKMDDTSKRTITRILGAEPVEINSSFVSAQSRGRLYWCNWRVNHPQDKKLIAKDILEDIPIENDDIRWSYDSCVPSSPYGKIKCIPAQGGNKSKGIGIYNDDCTKWRKLTPIECERVQTFPDNYTEGVSTAQRIKMIGNGWTKDVIVHLFNCLINPPKIYQMSFDDFLQ